MTEAKLLELIRSFYSRFYSAIGASILSFIGTIIAAIIAFRNNSRTIKANRIIVG